jgi:pentatricopeptide repeat protein
MNNISANMMQIFIDLETELLFFALAVATHMLFFHRWGKNHPYSMFFNRQLKGKEATMCHPQKSTTSSSEALALKTAFQTEDVKSAMIHFETLHGTNGDDSSSRAPHMLLEQLVKLAVCKGVQSELLQLATKLDMLGSTLDILLAESSGKEAHDVLETMRTSGMKPSITSFNKCLSSACNAEAAWRLVDEMHALGVQPDRATCSILLKNRYINSKADSLEKAIAITSSLDGEMDETLLNSVVDACIRVGRGDLMIPFIRKERALRRATVKNPRTYANIIRAYGHVQDVKGVWETWNEMQRQRVAPINITLGVMVEALVSNGDIEGGYELIQSMLHDENTASLVNSVMYGSVVKGFSHTKNFNRMWQVYDEMVQQKLQFSMVTYNTLIDACARSGELSRIPSLLRDIEAQGLKMGLVTYSAIIKGYCCKNMFDDAYELFQDMVNNTDLEPDEIMFNTLLDGCARQAMYDRGMLVFDMMQRSGVRPTNYTLSVLVKLADRGKKLEKAFELCEELTTAYHFRMNVHVYANLIQACIKNGDLPRAMGVLERMLQERVRPDVRSYSLLLRAFVDARQASDAAGLLRAVAGVSGKHPWNGPHPKLAKFATAALKPQAALPGDLISDVLLGIMDICHEERLAASLFADLGRQLPDLKLDPKLRLRLTARIADAR